MSVYERKNDGGGMTTFTFVKTTTLPPDVPISTPISFAFLDHRMLLVKKINGWWDIVGGKIEKSEDYIEALNREALEEGGAELHGHTLVGYVRAKIEGDTGIFPPVSVLPVTYAHIKKLNHPFVPNSEVMERELVKRDEVRSYLSSREDSGQLLQMALFAFERERSASYKYEFLYSPVIDVSLEKVQTTQAAALVRNSDGNYYAVREKDSEKFLLPGGGCRIKENGEACVRREIQEELGITEGALYPLGGIRVRMLNKQGAFLSEALHRRYLFETAATPTILPDSEIAECVALSMDKLMSIVEHLKNENGPKIRAAVEALAP